MARGGGEAQKLHHKNPQQYFLKIFFFQTGKGLLRGGGHPYYLIENKISLFFWNPIVCHIPFSVMEPPQRHNLWTFSIKGDCKKSHL